MSQYFFTAASSIRRLMLLLFAASTCLATSAQGITTYQYRRVPAEKSEEFLKRETTYWSKVAKKAIDKGALSFWALLERVDGADGDPNYLFINTYPDMDTDNGDIWNPAPLFPTIPVAKIETYSMSHVTNQFFLQDLAWEQASFTKPEKDFNYVIMVYHNSSNPNAFSEMEKRQWGPFIKSSMDNKQTAQVGWGNSVVLAPTGNNVRFNSVSFDLFPTLKSALLQEWKPDVKFPETGLDSLMKMTKAMPDREIYRIVKVEAKEQ
jgi:hypothetical protein